MSYADSVEHAIEKSIKEISAVLNASIQRNFQSGGRPPWPATHRGGATLMDTGRLARAVLVEVHLDSDDHIRGIARTQGVVYAAIHQFGGVITAKNAKFLAIPLTKEARLKTPRQMEGLFLVKKNGQPTSLCTSINGRVTAQYALKVSVRIPKREYILVQPEDWKDIRDILFGNVKEVVIYELSH